MSCVFFGHGTQCTRSPRPVQMKNSHLRTQTSKCALCCCTCADASRIKLHWSVFLSLVLHLLCAFFFFFRVRYVCMCQHTSDFFFLFFFFECGVDVYLMWPGFVVCLHLRVLSLQLTEKIPPPFQTVCQLLPTSPAAVLLLNPGMCYSSHVVMGCQRQP